MFKKILIAIDGTALSDAVFVRAIDLAAACHAELLVMQVVGYYNPNYVGATMPPTVYESNEVEVKQVKKAEEKLSALADAAKAKGVGTTAMLVRSDIVSDSILDVATEQGCDLIVMAPHTNNRLRKLLLGSETQHVLSHSMIPVLIVPESK